MVKRYSDICTAAADEIWSYLDHLPVADYKRLGTPYKWRRFAPDAIVLIFGARSFDSEQTCYCVAVNDERVELVCNEQSSGESQEISRTQVLLGDPRVFDIVRQYINVHAPRTK